MAEPRGDAVERCAPAVDDARLDANDRLDDVHGLCGRRHRRARRERDEDSGARDKLQGLQCFRSSRRVQRGRPAFDADVSGCQDGARASICAAVTTQRRWPIIALALASASLFVTSVQLGAWWTAGAVEIGPFGSKWCSGGECRPAGLRWLDGSELWMRGAIATGAAGLVTAFVLVALAGATAAGPKRHATELGYVARLAAKSSLVALVTPLVVGAWFVIGFPGVGDAHASIDRGAILYALAIPVGAVAAVRALRWRRE